MCGDLAVCVEKRNGQPLRAARTRSLAAEAELRVDGAIALDIDLAQVRLEAAALTDELEEARRLW